MHIFIINVFKFVTSSVSIIAPLCICLILLTGCAGGTVQFVDPPNADADQLVRYTHSGGAFALDVPRGWALYEQNTTALASAAFTPPEGSDPLLLIAVIDAGRSFDAASLTEVVDRYQSHIRPYVTDYVETARETLPDGSWRMAGYRQAINGNFPVNTFLQASGSRLALIELTPAAPLDNERTAQVEHIINSLRIDPAAPLEPSDIATLGFARTSTLASLHVSAWVAPDGALFVTGEVGNYGSSPISGIPVDVSIIAGDGQPLFGAVDVPMGYGIPPGGFAPFSLRFGEGIPVNGGDFIVRLGGADWTPDNPIVFNAPDELRWVDSSSFDGQGGLLINGEVTNAGSRALRNLRAIVTVFDSDQNVIGAAQVDLETASLAPGESAPFEIPISALGDIPANYIVSVQGIP